MPKATTTKIKTKTLSPFLRTSRTYLRSLRATLLEAPGEGQGAGPGANLARRARLLDAVEYGAYARARLKAEGHDQVVSGDQPEPCRSGRGCPGMYRGVMVSGKRMLNDRSS